MTWPEFRTNEPQIRCHSTKLTPRYSCTPAVYLILTKQVKQKEFVLNPQRYRQSRDDWQLVAHMTLSLTMNLGYGWISTRPRRFKADSHIACRVHAVPLPCRATNGLECLSHLIYTLRPSLIHSCHAMLRPWRSSQGHGTARPSRDGLWATCPRSASSGYHAEFHEVCHQNHTNLRCRWPVWNQTTFVMDEEKSGSSTLLKRRCVKLLD